MACHSKEARAEMTRRLGRAELGPHVHERQMPFWLRKMLERGAKVTHTNQIAPDGTLRKLGTVENEATDIIPILGRLCRADKSVSRAFLCSPRIWQISKLPREGGFCGYRNIQMLISYIRQSDLPGHDCLSGSLPTILQLQDMIEHAWDMGFNSVGREETGGIRGTRKFIGTSEAQALFLSLGIQCEARSIGGTQQLQAHDALLSIIADYFRQGSPCHTNEKVVMTCLPPIYFQHQGHSLTIVGFEIRDNGSANLLVFDPMLKVPSGMKRSMGPGSRFRDPLHALKRYRRGTSYLQKYQLFEILKPPPPPPPARSRSRPSFTGKNFQFWLLGTAAEAKMRTTPNVIITGTPGVGKTVHCQQLAQDTGLQHLSINQVAKERDCFETYDSELETWVVDEDKLLDAIEEEILEGGYLIDWHACDLFPKSWIDLVVVLRCPSTSVHYDRLSTRSYKQEKLQENLDAEIFGVLLEEAREAFDEEVVVELSSERDDDVENNCARISTWIESWKKDHSEVE
ncbi:DUF1671-domain-containing protein [Aspergillus steynii IBT 23096]|uniref:Adenylate kinase isoenzyme 6 homolog n=1 Tax=Aspergillus steynii IBT 23096 TaxID=1392250 RepID=A0A2I2GFX8_9EURO|nr:DUF1671-domain-containing protein [Aspergillus steynii IBT 23096]PLB51782.1 DUF1671-domain-containing protein [Aspergillus steynii IBT 23096]